ncbi:MAG: hypothetical protein IT175_07200 [Acidobacteria bacterium]|nr:hypothetical protein [Acidobacteriota bacterium]
MGNASERIHQPKGALCPIIQLTDSELPLSSGAGWHIARFVDGTLQELVLLETFLPPRIVDAEKRANAGLAGILAWLRTAGSEVYLVMCSATELCEPVPLSGDAAAAGLARLARLMGEVTTPSAKADGFSGKPGYRQAWCPKAQSEPQDQEGRNVIARQ